MRRHTTLLAVMAFALLIVSSGCAPAQSKLEVTDPWARAADVMPASEDTGSMGSDTDTAETAAMADHSGAVSAAYMTIRNTGGAADRLVSATTDAAGIVEIHTVEMENDIMRMRPLPDGLALPAGEAVTLQPGGYHIMLMALRESLVAGETLPLTLTFESGTTLIVEAAIRAP